MKTFATVFALVSLLPGIFALTVNTPSNVVACQPILLTWADGTAPYFLSIIPGGQPSAAAIKTFPTQNGNSLTWNVDLPPNTGITISLKDSTGAQAYSDVVTVQGSDTSCANTSVAVSGTGDASGAAPTATGGAPSGSGSSTPAAPTNASNAATTSKPATSGGSSTSKGSGTSTGAGASTTSNAASKATLGKFGLAGLLGLVGLAAL